MNKSSDKDKPDPSTLQMPKFGMRWYQYNPAYHMAATLKASAQAKADYYDTLNQALILGTRGLNPEADKMLDNADHVSNVRRRVALNHHAHVRNDTNAMHLQSKSSALPTDQPIRPTEPELSPEPRPKEPEQLQDSRLGVSTGYILGSGKGDKYEQIASLSHEDLPGYAAEFCTEADPNRAVTAYKRIIRIIGPEAFRAELTSFVGDCGADREPKSRGAAFMARLKRLVAAKLTKGAA